MNPEEVINNIAKPRVEERGPYVYCESRRKVQTTSSSENNFEDPTHFYVASLSNFNQGMTKNSVF